MQGLGSFMSMEGRNSYLSDARAGLYITRAKQWRMLQKRGPGIPGDRRSWKGLMWLIGLDPGDESIILGTMSGRGEWINSSGEK